MICQFFSCGFSVERSEVAVLEPLAVMPLFPQAVVKVETAGELLPETCRLACGMEHDRKIQINKAVAHHVGSEVSTAVHLVVVVRISQVELTAVERVEWEQLLAPVERFIKLEPAPAGRCCGDKATLVVLALLAAVAFHCEDCTGIQSQ